MYDNRIKQSRGSMASLVEAMDRPRTDCAATVNRSGTNTFAALNGSTHVDLDITHPPTWREEEGIELT